MYLFRLKKRNGPGNKKHGTDIDALNYRQCSTECSRPYHDSGDGMIKSSKGTIHFPFGGFLQAAAKV
jgi:hypothetical protein